MKIHTPMMIMIGNKLMIMSDQLLLAMKLKSFNFPSATAFLISFEKFGRYRSQMYVEGPLLGRSKISLATFGVLFLLAPPALRKLRPLFCCKQLLFLNLSFSNIR
jgi:hypothetical protein